MDTVRKNLMSVKWYSPYCGSSGSLCTLPRTHFDGQQFVCRQCGRRSGFPKEFITEYKKKWGIKRNGV